MQTKPAWAFHRVAVCCVLLRLALLATAAETLPLAGEWRFALDRADVGVKELWFNRDLPDRIQLPGVLQAQGYGDEISTNTPWVLSLYDHNWFLREDYQAYTKPGHVKVPFLCQPPRHYLGAAWYQRDIDIPTNWVGRRVVLFLERTRWESRAWLDDRPLGTNNSLCVPHEFEAGVVGAEPNQIKPGKHRLTVRCDNRMLMDYRPDAHAVSDSLGSTWNGIEGQIELRSTPLVWIEEVRVVPDAKTESARVKVRIGNASGRSVSNLVSLNFIPVKADGGGKPAVMEVVSTSWWTTVEAELQSGYPVTAWDEFHPQLFELTVARSSPLPGGDLGSEIKRLIFGFCNLRTDASKLLINGREAHLRGTHFGGDFPLTGYPPCDVESWLKIFRTCKEWGLNHVRFHSFCPPEAAFTAADQLGIYLQIEPGMWNVISPGTPMEEMLYAETERILKAYGNHPSFVLMSASNEAKGHWKEALSKWVEHFRQEDPRRLYTPDTGWSLIDEPGPVEGADYLAVHRIGGNMMRGERGWFGRDYSRATRGVNVPIVTHEVGQWCAYPDYDVIEKFTGYLRPGNFEIFRDSAEAHGLMGDLALAGPAAGDAAINSGEPTPDPSQEGNAGLRRAGPSVPLLGGVRGGFGGMTKPDVKDFARASGRFQLECYKEEIEANLRTPGLAGFQLLDLHDYVGQGTALVGVLDPFWEEKGYVKAGEWRQFCSAVVPLARLTQRVFTTADRFDVPVEVANYSAQAMTNARVSWAITDATGRAAAHGEWPEQTLAIGRTPKVGIVKVDLAKLAAPGQFKLQVSVNPSSAAQGMDGRDTRATTATTNTWNFWLYSAREDASVPKDVLLTSSWDEAAARLAAGGRVVFQPPQADLDWSSPPLDRLPVFWNRLMGPGWSRMLGLWCDTNHPALAEFPTEANCDWQWTQIIKTRAMNLDGLPRSLEPIVSAIDDWNRNWKLGLIFECRVGPGRLLVSTSDLGADNPVAKQLRRSLLDYATGDKFQPKAAVPATDLRGEWFDTLVMRKLGATATADGGEAGAAIDGDPNTFWLTGASVRGAKPVRHPHELTITFPRAVPMSGVVLMDRQNDRDHQGDIRGYTISVSDDGQSWREVLRGELPSTWNPQTLRFPRTITGKQLKLTALSGYGNDPSAALAELAVLYAGPKLGGVQGGAVEYQRVKSTSTDIDEGGN